MVQPLKFGDDLVIPSHILMSDSLSMLELKLSHAGTRAPN